MRFIDPYVLLQLNVTDPSAVTDAMLQVAQAKLHAAIQASRSSELRVGGKKIFEDDAEVLSKAMSDPQARQRFWEMRLVGGMVPFLEGGEARDLQPLLVRSQATGQDFHAFASRWLAPAIDWMLHVALHSGKWVDGVMLARGIGKLHPLSEQAAIVASKSYFQTLAQDLERRTLAPQQLLTEADFKPFCLSAMLGVLNNLPAGAQGVRDAYATALGAAVVASAAAHRDQPWTFAIGQSASQIKVSAALQNQVQNMLQRVKDDSGITAHEIRQARNAKLAAAGGGIMLIIIFLLKIILGLLQS